eukprot:GILK01005232.1.p1 GENE.GILK01005232.1~~GILK01005232.1.p1  ORF type:complete len:343 (+),score=14.00 GILK01005232.1:74-1102(+)
MEGSLHRYSFHAFFLATSFLLYQFSVLYLIIDPQGFDSCPNDGPPNPPLNSFWQSTYGLWANLGVLCVMASILLWKPANPMLVLSGDSNGYSLRWNSLWMFSGWIIMTLGGSMTIHAVKQSMDDRLCSTIPNGISGHYYFFISLVVGFPVLIVRLHRDASDLRSYANAKLFRAITHRRLRARSAALLLSYFVLFCVCVIICTSTWSNGYHTPRQMVYGTYAAILQLWIFMTLAQQLRVLTPPWLLLQQPVADASDSMQRQHTKPRSLLATFTFSSLYALQQVFDFATVPIIYDPLKFYGCLVAVCAHVAIYKWKKAQAFPSCHSYITIQEATPTAIEMQMTC